MSLEKWLVESTAASLSEEIGGFSGRGNGSWVAIILDQPEMKTWNLHTVFA